MKFKYNTKSIYQLDKQKEIFESLNLRINQKIYETEKYFKRVELPKALLLKLYLKGKVSTFTTQFYGKEKPLVINVNSELLMSLSKRYNVKGYFAKYILEDLMNFTITISEKEIDMYAKSLDGKRIVKIFEGKCIKI